MVFTAIAFWLLVAAVPLWAYRWVAYSRMSPDEKLIFKRLVSRRHENAVGFALRIFGFLVALSAAVIVVVFGLRYLKYGRFELSPYRDLIRSRFYSGVDPFDRALDTFHYDQMLPVAILTTCLLLSVAFTLVSAALRDITVMHRLRRKMAGLRKRSSGEM